MKKLLCMFIIVVLTLSVALSSCEFPSMPWQNTGGNGDSTENTTATLMSNVFETMDGISSLDIDTEMEVLIYVAATKMTIEGTSRNIYQISDDNGVYFYNESNATVRTSTLESAISTIEAYNDGNYFVSFSKDGILKRLYSENSEEEFLDYYNNTSDEKNVFDGYSKASHVENGDGTYTVTLTEYDQEVVDSLNQDLGLPMENGGGRVVDCTVTLTVNSDYTIGEAKVDYVFSNTEFSGSQILTFGNYNTAKKITDTINAEDYTKVSDAIGVSLYLTLVSERENSTNGFFTFYLNQVAKLGSTSSVFEENDTVSYGVNDDGYFFDLDAEINGENYEITYSDGEYKIDGEIDKTADHNDVTSKEFINALIDPFGITPLEIQDVTVLDEGDQKVYTFKLYQHYGNVYDKVSAIFTQSRATYQSADMYMEITINNYEIVSIEYKISAVGRTGMNKMYLDIETYTDFTA